MEIYPNPLRGLGLPDFQDSIGYALRDDPAPVQDLLRRCPHARETPLLRIPSLAGALDIGTLLVKDERDRMGMGSFKALGAAYAIARAAYARHQDALFAPGAATDALAGEVFITASAGNHGLSVAAGAKAFGARAVIYLAKTVPEKFAQSLRDRGAETVIEGENYEEAMQAAAERAATEGWLLLSDSTWAGYGIGVDVMEGYLAMVQEITDASSTAPTHVFLQAGVGGLAAAVAAGFRRAWGNDLIITVVEPVAAPCLLGSIKARKPVKVEGPVSEMGRLDCKEPSFAALAALSHDADFFMTLSDAQVDQQIKRLKASGLATTQSGGAGFAGLAIAAKKGVMGLTETSRALVILSESA